MCYVKAPCSTCPRCDSKDIRVTPVARLRGTSYQVHCRDCQEELNLKAMGIIYDPREDELLQLQIQLDEALGRPWVTSEYDTP